MSDLGQDRESLEVKILEIEHSIAQSELAKKSIDLDKARIAAKLKQYAKSHEEIDAKIKEYQVSVSSIREALSKMRN